MSTSRQVVIQANIEIRDPDKLLMFVPGFTEDASGAPEGMMNMGRREQLEWAVDHILGEAMAAMEDRTGLHHYGGGATVLREANGWVEGLRRPDMPPPGWVPGDSEPPDWTKVPFDF